MQYDVEPVGSRFAEWRADRAVAIWLLVCAAMVAIIVVIGGITRLTESGLSITEWKPVSGIVPPLTAQQWDEEFARYRTTTEYQQLNTGMTMGQFRQIFFWEYLHRLWGRLIGAVFALPFFVFLARGRVRQPLTARLWTILILIALQGALGWYMVRSGLSGRTDVSQYRLAAHLCLALVIYCIVLWNGLALLWGRASSNAAPFFISTMRSAVRARVTVVFLLVCGTIVSGAFVAGLNAGKIYNTFPLMGGALVPASYLQLEPVYLNFFENPVTAQFNHRLLAVLTFAAVVYLWLWARKIELPRLPRTAINWMAGLAVLQVALGIGALLAAVPLELGVAHQAGAVLLLTAAIAALRSLL